MAVWYEVGKTEEAVWAFLQANCMFGDFRQERFTYVPGADMVEILYGYDSRTEGVLLRFAWIHGIHPACANDYDADWISGTGSEVLLLPNSTEAKTFMWLEYGDGAEIGSLEERKSQTTWVESERLFWAHTDEKGNPIEMPEAWICGTEGMEFHGDWNTILKPWYDRA